MVLLHRFDVLISRYFAISVIVIIINKCIECNSMVVAADNNDSYGDSDYEEGYCAPYNGRVCKSYITSQVWYSRVSDD